MQDKGAKLKCREIVTNRWWKAYWFARLQSTECWEWCFSGGWQWMVISYRVRIAEIDAGWAAAQIIEGVKSPPEVHVGQVKVGVVVVDVSLKCWWQGLLERFMEKWCFGKGCVGREVLM